MTKIEWADRSWNPITGCTKISEGCMNCYAERMAKRLAGRCGYSKDNPFEITVHENRMNDPIKWRKPSRIFVCSMGDLFHNKTPDWAIEKVFETIDKCPNHTFIILTKRAAGMHSFMVTSRANKQKENVWIGVTIENQEEANHRIQYLLDTPALVRFVSIEPMLSEIDLSFNIQVKHEKNEGFGIQAIDRIDWVICGGETGPGARPMHPGWVHQLINQCANNLVPFFFKQWGEWCPRQSGVYCTDDKVKRIRLSLNGRNDQTDPISDGNASWMNRVGKKRAGRLIYGESYEEFPEVFP